MDDRYFVNRFADRIWEFDGGTFTDFPGSYQEFLAYKEKNAAAVRASKAMKSASAKNDDAEQSAKRANKKRIKKPSDAQKEVRRLEREIEKLEAEIVQIQLQKDEYGADYEKLMELDKQEAVVQGELAQLLLDWERSLSACDGLM